MAEEQVFRFLSVRSPSEPPLRDGMVRRVGYSVTGDDPPLVQTLVRLPLGDRTSDTLARIMARFRESDRYVRDLGSLPFDPRPLANWVDANRGEKLAALDLPAFAQQTWNDSPADIVRTQSFVDTALRLAETLFADAFGSANKVRRRDDIVHAIKLLHLLAAAAKDIRPARDETLGEFIARMLVVLPDVSRAPVPKREPTIQPPRMKPGQDDRTKFLSERLEKLSAAHGDVSAALARQDAVHVSSRRQTTNAAAGGAKVAELEAQLAALAARLDKSGDAAKAPSLLPGATAGGVVEVKQKVAFSYAAADTLAPGTKALLQELRIDLRNANPFASLDTIEEQMTRTAAEIPLVGARQKVISLGGVLLDSEVLARSFGYFGGLIDWETLPLHEPCSYLAGVGDLLIVRQKLKAYELGDFAHVENVLRGEKRSREHRRLSIREEISEVETERETEKERDLQSTERNEMQNEATKTVQSQFQLDAGLQVSGSYGPSVSFSASLNVGFSTSTEESQRKAQTFSREVTDRTSERIRDRVREERRRRVLEQVEEINAHSLANDVAPRGHIRGIYRWLNKIYDAQIYNYGQRMMYEFVVPEPAAYYLYAMVENPPADLELEKPRPPEFRGLPLKPENLTRMNYQGYLAAYEVTNAKAPPSSFKNVAYFDKQEGTEAGQYGRGSKLAIPDGYEAVSAVSASRYSLRRGDEAALEVWIGSQPAPASFGTPFRDEISVGIIGVNLVAFMVTIDVHCRLTTEGFAKWQHDTYAAIMEAYLNQRAAYEEKLAQQEMQRGPQILGRNPLENRRLERDELKKLVTMMLRQSSSLNLNSFYSSGEPVMNITRACENGAVVRFFENAFEWNNMTYVFYPYFWGRKARWISALHLTDPDPDFAAFLRAGAARVQVPVRPGFERALAWFCSTGEIWEGTDVPVIGDATYVPIIEEITENLGRLDEGVPYPSEDPWEVTVPTSLVVVQDLEEIPAIRDGLTGNPIRLTGGDA